MITKHILLLIFCIHFFGMNSLIGCSPNKTELFRETDAFVESLYTTYRSYGLFGGTAYSKTTNDGLYKIMPIGRLINVRIEKPVSADVYETLRKDLEDYYENDVRVNRVYICRGGTIMIDCRN